MLGYATLAFGFLGFAAWGGTAPIEGAVLSPGVFVATTQNKVVQHLEGGIIRDILVREGQIVAAGEPLIRLDDTAAKTELNRLQLRQAHLRVASARLGAEIEREAAFEVPSDLLTDAAAGPRAGDIRAIIETHTILFETRRKKLASEIAIQEQTIAALGHRISGDTAKRDATLGQLALVDEELAGKSELYKKGLIRKPDYLAIRRLQENLKGEALRLESEVHDSNERIVSSRQQIERQISIAVQSATEELHATSSELKDVRERLNTAAAVLSRVAIEAPVAGAVVKLNYHTAGGVIRPGNDILALLPLADELVIEGRIRPQDINNVKVGQAAYVRLSALNQRVVPMVPGKVAYVSPDALPNERKLSEDNGYIARISIDITGIPELASFRPTPGMPAEIFIKTGDRTFFEYLMRPVKDSFARAFRET
jgi:HlyD family secretion protein